MRAPCGATRAEIMAWSNCIHITMHFYYYVRCENSSPTFTSRQHSPRERNCWSIEDRVLETWLIDIVMRESFYIKHTLQTPPWSFVADMCARGAPLPMLIWCTYTDFLCQLHAWLDVWHGIRKKMFPPPGRINDANAHIGLGFLTLRLLFQRELFQLSLHGARRDSSKSAFAKFVSVIRGMEPAPVSLGCKGFLYLGNYKENYKFLNGYIITLQCVFQMGTIITFGNTFLPVAVICLLTWALCVGKLPRKF